MCVLVTVILRVSAGFLCPRAEQDDRPSNFGRLWYSGRHKEKAELDRNLFHDASCSARV
jgi:hypothetical protein